MQRSFMLLSDKSNDSKIVSVNHIIESEVPELPMETSFKVNWFVVEGNQIQYRKESTNSSGMHLLPSGRRRRRLR